MLKILKGDKFNLSFIGFSAIYFPLWIYFSKSSLCYILCVMLVTKGKSKYLCKCYLMELVYFL